MKSTRVALPPRVSRPWIVGAVAVWLVTALFGQPVGPAVPAGPFAGEIVLVTDVHEGRYGTWALAGVGDSVVFTDVPMPAGRGDHLQVEGIMRSVRGVAAGKGYTGSLAVSRVVSRQVSTFLPHRVGLAIRDRVHARLRPLDDGRGLLMGFLIGDTSGISQLDNDAMRRSGLTHFVAVSGSNVALFLGLLAITAGPLALGPRRRAIVGLLGLPIYAAATRFEPSVMRASAMAGIALAGRLVNVVLEAWQLLSVAVIVLLLVDPELTGSLGFQLSVAATAGVLVGSRWPVTGPVKKAVAITIGAQVAVAPLLLLGFGTIPLLSPMVNLVAAPLVTGATLLGTVGVVGPAVLIRPAAWLSSLVLAVARGAAGWPQLDVWQMSAVLLGGLLFTWLRRLRGPLIVLASVVVAFVVVTPGASLPSGSVVVLDVGQGDAILLSGGDDRFVLVDGGPDPAAAVRAVGRYGVSAIELVVLTHVHADHAAGLVGVLARMPVGRIWAVPEPHSTPASDELFAQARAKAVPIVAPEPGTELAVGSLTLQVVGPVRRYAGANDHSIVVLVSGRARTMLLSGDIERIAQSDLTGMRADVLKVPHHGSGTSDPDWIASVGASVAVIPVGENDFGHPAQWVVDVLERSGAVVLRTDRDGDVIVDLDAELSASNRGQWASRFGYGA